jgi:hypothetical protein
VGANWLAGLPAASRVADPDPVYFWKLDPDPHVSQISEALEAQSKVVGGRERSQCRPGYSKRSPGGSIDQWSKIPITLMRSRIRIRIHIEVESRIRIRLKVKKLDPNPDEVMWIRNPSRKAGLKSRPTAWHPRGVGGLFDFMRIQRGPSYTSAIQVKSYSKKGKNRQQNNFLSFPMSLPLGKKKTEWWRQLITSKQCCGSGSGAFLTPGSGIWCLFDPWIRDPE